MSANAIGLIILVVVVAGFLYVLYWDSKRDKTSKNEDKVMGLRWDKGLRPIVSTIKDGWLHYKIGKKERYVVMPPTKEPIDPPDWKDPDNPKIPKGKLGTYIIYKDNFLASLIQIKTVLVKNKAEVDENFEEVEKLDEEAGPNVVKTEPGVYKTKIHIPAVDIYVTEAQLDKFDKEVAFALPAPPIDKYKMDDTAQIYQVGTKVFSIDNFVHLCNPTRGWPGQVGLSKHEQAMSEHMAAAKQKHFKRGVKQTIQALWGILGTAAIAIAIMVMIATGAIDPNEQAQMAGALVICLVMAAGTILQINSIYAPLRKQG